MYCFDTCKLFELNKPISRSIFLESVLLISMYEFTDLTLHITFWLWKYDFWTGSLLNVRSFYFYGEELIIQINNVLSCCVQKKLNVPLISELPACLSVKATSLSDFVCLSVFMVCFLTAGVTAVVTLPIVYGLSYLNGGLLWALRLYVNRHWCGLTWLTQFHLKLWIRRLPIGTCRMCACILFVQAVMCREWKLCGCSLQMENHLHLFLSLLQSHHSSNAVE